MVMNMSMDKTAKGTVVAVGTKAGCERAFRV